MHVLMNNMVDNLGDCGAGNSVDLGGDVSFSASKEFGDGFNLVLGFQLIQEKHLEVFSLKKEDDMRML